jgi:hypothetical protein
MSISGLATVRANLLSLYYERDVPIVASAFDRVAGGGNVKAVEGLLTAVPVGPMGWQKVPAEMRKKLLMVLTPVKAAPNSPAERSDELLMSIYLVAFVKDVASAYLEQLR